MAAEVVSYGVVRAHYVERDDAGVAGEDRVPKLQSDGVDDLVGTGSLMRKMLELG